MHAPAWHVSACVHAFPSLHVVPLVAVGFEHVPVVGLHDPATWHWSCAVHTTGLDPVQTPAWQAYVCSHLFVPGHDVPLAAAVWVHVPSPLHVSTVQGLPSSHDDAVQHSPPAFRIAVS